MLVKTVTHMRAIRLSMAEVGLRQAKRILLLVQWNYFHSYHKKLSAEGFSWQSNTGSWTRGPMREKRFQSFLEHSYRKILSHEKKTQYLESIWTIRKCGWKDLSHIVETYTFIYHSIVLIFKWRIIKKKLFSKLFLFSFILVFDLYYR